MADSGCAFHLMAFLRRMLQLRYGSSRRGR